MAEIWVAAAVTVGGAVVSGYAAEKKDKADKKYATATNEKEARFNAQQTGYEAALEDYYKQKGRYETQRGLDEFRKFSTTGNYMPGYSDATARIAEPVAPDYNKFAPAVPEKAAGGGEGGKSTWEKLDPLGSKIIKNDMKNLKKIFSDRQLKTDVERVGTLDNGLPVYKYRYVDGGPFHIGLMADEVEVLHPQAVEVMENGYKAVDYSEAVK